MSRVQQASSAAETAPTKVPRSCSDVFRLWAAVLVSPLVALAFEMVVYVAEVSGLRERPTGQRATVEFDFGAQLVAWNSFAMTYLLLIEWDNTQRKANHAHSVWRDPTADFGLDVLARHRAVHHR